MTVLDQSAVDRWVAAWRDRATDGGDLVARVDLHHRRWTAVLGSGQGTEDLPAAGTDPLDRCLAAVAVGVRDARRIDGTEAVAGIHLAAGLLAGAAELQALDEVVAHDLWQVGLAAADLAGSGADLGTVAAATAAFDERDAGELGAGLGVVFAALRSALSVPDRIVLLDCGAGPGFNPGDPVLLEITCAVPTSEFLMAGVDDLLESEVGVSAVEFWPAGERTWVHLHTSRSGPVLELLAGLVRLEELRITAPHGTGR